MNTPQAIDAFSALAHETRLTVFRLLIKEGELGVSAGIIAQRLEVQPSTLTAHLHILRRSGLIKSERQKQKILYSANIQGTRELIRFLTQECCQGQPEICAELFEPGQAC
jgi:ArsR family transcriptional regulator